MSDTEPARDRWVDNRSMRGRREGDVGAAGHARWWTGEGERDEHVIDRASGDERAMGGGARVRQEWQVFDLAWRASGDERATQNRHVIDM